MYPRQIRTALLLSLTLICFSSIAQKSYIAGFIVTLKGDTINGLVDYKNWEINPRSVSFKKNAKESSVLLGLNDILSFDVPGKDRYVRSIVYKDMRPVDLDHLRVISD